MAARDEQGSLKHSPRQPQAKSGELWAFAGVLAPPNAASGALNHLSEVFIQFKSLPLELKNQGTDLHWNRRSADLHWAERIPKGRVGPIRSAHGPRPTMFRRTYRFFSSHFGGLIG